MDPDALQMIALPVTAFAIFALWRILMRRPRAGVIRDNFDALKDKEMDRNRLASLVILIVLSAMPAWAQSTSPPKSGSQSTGPVTVTDSYGNRKGYISSDGVVRDNYGNRVGYIQQDGTVKDSYGNKVGQVKKP